MQDTGVSQATRDFMRTLGLRACATCGKAAGGDAASVSAIYSVGIEVPSIMEHICACPMPAAQP